MRIWNWKAMTLRATLITIWPGSPFSPQHPLSGCEQWEGVAKCKLIWGWRRLDWNNFFFSSRSIRPYAILQCTYREIRNSLLFLSPSVVIVTQNGQTCPGDLGRRATPCSVSQTSKYRESCKRLSTVSSDIGIHISEEFIHFTMFCLFWLRAPSGKNFFLCQPNIFLSGIFSRIKKRRLRVNPHEDFSCIYMGTLRQMGKGREQLDEATQGQCHVGGGHLLWLWSKTCRPKQTYRIT